MQNYNETGKPFTRGPNAKDVTRMDENLLKQDFFSNRFIPKSSIPAILKDAILLPTNEIGGRDKQVINDNWNHIPLVSFYIEPPARNIIEIMPITEKRQSIKLVAADANILKLPERPTTRQVWKRVRKLGKLVPPDTFMDVFLDIAGEHVDLGIKESMVMIMDPIKDKDGIPRVFVCEYDKYGYLILNAYYAHPDYHWSPGAYFVFSPRK
jgi:hypothetical protein